MQPGILPWAALVTKGAPMGLGPSWAVYDWVGRKVKTQGREWWLVIPPWPVYQLHLFHGEASSVGSPGVVKVCSGGSAGHPFQYVAMQIITSDPEKNWVISWL